jgi:hypothetical protein
MFRSRMGTGHTEKLATKPMPSDEVRTGADMTGRLAWQAGQAARDAHHTHTPTQEGLAEIRAIPGIRHSPCCHLARDRDPKNPKDPNLAPSMTQIDIQHTLANNGPGQKLLPRGGGRGRACASRPGPFSLLAVPSHPSLPILPAPKPRGGSVGSVRTMHPAAAASID